MVISYLSVSPSAALSLPFQSKPSSGQPSGAESGGRVAGGGSTPASVIAALVLARLGLPAPSSVGSCCRAGPGIGVERPRREHVPEGGGSVSPRLAAVARPRGGPTEQPPLSFLFRSRQACRACRGLPWWTAFKGVGRPACVG